jgi:modulator of FtsH protease HflK
MANKEDNIELNQLAKPDSKTKELDTASKSLTEALEVSFVILKVIMVILVIAFLASGFKTVNPDEKALVLRFGKIRGTGDDRVLGSENSPYWILPYPIDEMIKIPAERTYNLKIDDFWYYLSDNEKLQKTPPAVDPNKPLIPIRDGYCLTRSEKREDSDVKGNDYNLVHTKWNIDYQIINPELFFTNVQIPDKKVSDINQDVFREGLEPILRNVLDDVVVTTMVNYTIDEAITSTSRIRDDVKERLQAKLKDIDSGVLVKTVQLENAEVPRQVKKDFELSIEASQNRNTAITNAERESTNLLNGTAGPVARKLYEALNDKTTSDEELASLWVQLKGRAQAKLSDSEIYATTVVSNAEASANYLKSLLPEYRKNPDIVVSKLYYDMLQKVYENAEEIMAVNNKTGASGSEMWILLNRDTSLKPKDKSTQN